MVDFIYNVIRRPIANDPEQKDIYHVDKAHKDAKTKRIEDDDPKQQGKQGSSSEEQSSSKTDVADAKSADLEKDKELTPPKKGRGKYVDENGVEHLDFYA